MVSVDGRILMCGHILIQLNKALDDIEEMGCIYMKKDHSIIFYEFLSFFKPNDRKEIFNIAKRQNFEFNMIKFEHDYEPA